MAGAPRRRALAAFLVIVIGGAVYWLVAGPGANTPSGGAVGGADTTRASRGPDARSGETGAVHTVSCANGKTIRVSTGRVSTGRVSADRGGTERGDTGEAAGLRLALPDGSRHRLRAVAPEAGGGRYATADSAVVLEVAGGTATVRREGAPVVEACTAPVLQGGGVLGVPAFWASARSPAAAGHRFVVRHPHGLRVDTSAHRGRQVLQFLYAGPDNEPPALTDGFTVSVEIAGRSDTLTLRAAARSRIRTTREVGGEVRQAVRDTTVQGRRALAWSQESAMGGVVDHRLVALGPQAMASVTNSVVGRRPAYEATIAAMLRSLRFRAAGAPRAGPSRLHAVPLAVLAAPAGEPDRGCDDVAWVTRWVESAPGPSARATAALRRLFAVEADSLGGHRHFLGRTGDTLRLDTVRVAGGTAEVRLSGRLTGLRGVCDHPRARIQIEETVRAATGTDRVVLFRNGTRTDLTPDGRGASAAR
jgi:hypothetical protein